MIGEHVDALITGAVGPVTVLIVGYLLNRKIGKVKSDTDATRRQVENDHTTNFREDTDAKHSENSTLLKRIARDVGWLIYTVDGHTEQIDELTQPHERKRYDPRRNRHRADEGN